MSSVRKYLSQKGENNCGPIAMYNFLVWAKQNPRKTDMRILRKLLRTKKRGTSLDNVMSFLSFFTDEYDINYYDTRNITNPMKTLRNGGCLLVVFDGNTEIPHICLVDGMVGEKVSFINAVKNKKQLLLTPRQFKNVMLNSNMTPLFVSIVKKRR